MENSLDNKYKKFLGVSHVELQKSERERGPSCICRITFIISIYQYNSLNWVCFIPYWIHSFIRDGWYPF